MGRARRGGDLGDDLPARAEAGIDEPGGLETGERAAIVVEVIRLPADRAVPRQAEPREVLQDRSLELRTAARPVDVLDAQEERAAARAGLPLREACGIGVPEVQVAAG
jgi:hypothetical protein